MQLVLGHTDAGFDKNLISVKNLMIVPPQKLLQTRPDEGPGPHVLRFFLDPIDFLRLRVLR